MNTRRRTNVVDPPTPAAGPGPGVDASGNAVIDPTRNVLDLVSAAIARQDDLRTAESRHIRELASTRAAYDHQIREMDQALADVRASYESQLSEKESQRIDAIRAVDVDAVARAAEVSATQASAQATQAIQTAEALRGQVEGTRIATADALAQALAPITKSIEDLRAAQYAQQGERSATVPIAEQLAPLISEIRALSQAQSRGAGERVAAGELGVSHRGVTGLWIAAAAVASSFFLGATGIIVTLVLR